MNIGFLGSATSWYLQDLRRAAGDEHVVSALPFSKIASSIAVRQPITASSEGTDLTDFDVLLVRSMPLGSLEQVVFRMNVLARCEALGHCVVNPPRSLEVAIDKYLCLELLRGAGFDVPPTVVCQTVDEAMEGFETLGGDIVLKPIFGGEGRGVSRVRDPAIALHAFKLFSQNGAVLYLQKFIEHDGFDYRMLGIRDKVLGITVLGITRHNCNDWRTNISLGGQAERLQVTDQLAEATQRAMTATGVHLGAVDLLPGRDGKLYALEINAVPGWRAVARCLDVDVSKLVVDFLINEVAATQQNPRPK